MGVFFSDVPIKPGEIEKRLVCPRIEDEAVRSLTPHKLAVLEKGDLEKMGFALGDLGVTLAAFSEWGGRQGLTSLSLSLSLLEQPPLHFHLSCHRRSHLLPERSVISVTVLLVTCHCELAFLTLYSSMYSYTAPL
jgi:hypothetical protein